MKPALADAYDEHVYDVYGFLAYRLSSRIEAEDLTQATFERAVRSWSRFDPERASVKTWLLSIANNLLIDHYRADRSTSQQRLDDLVEHDRSLRTDTDFDRGLGLSAELADALGALGDRDRQVLALRFGGDLTGPEIAQVLDLSLSNVQQILSRSLRRLREELGP